MNKKPAVDQTFFIPDLCQTQSLLMLILIAELCVLAWTLASGDFSWVLLGFRSITVQWVVLLCAVVLCQARPFLSKMSLRNGWLISFALIEAISLTVVVLGYAWINPELISVSVIVQVALAIAIVAAMVLRFFQLLRQVIDQNQAEMTSRMDALQARIKPHFLFNSLNTIAELIASRPEAAEQAVENLSSLFRANLKETSSFCPLSQEISLVKGYLELEQWRLGDRLDVEWRESIAEQQWPVPVLCLQPLVENAVLHGVASQTHGGKVIISVLQTPRVTTLSVENSIGSQAETHKGHGVGLDNIQKRMQVLYGPSAKCRVEKTPEHYKVIVNLPKEPLEPVS